MPRHALILPLAYALLLGAPMGARCDEPYGRHDFDASAREHWAFQPVVRPEPPQPQDAEWVRTPIDAFIALQLEENGLRPNPPAERGRLLRRLYLDLIGLLPTIDEQDRFLADGSPEAVARVVDELLARPEYGERWARHWLDVVRYAETNGYERDNPKPQAWRYRDWVIDALNSDKPFDEFVIEQLAGDELPDTDAQKQIATTFLRLGLWDDEPADPEVDRYDQLDDLVAATSAAFLAQTIRCARCHDHKYEPFTQRDYTRLLARFEPLKRPQKDRDDLDRFVGTLAELAAFEAVHSEWKSKRDLVQARLDALRSALRERLLAQPPVDWSQATVEAFRTEPDKRTPEQKQLVTDHTAAFDQALVSTATGIEYEVRIADELELGALDQARPAEPLRGYVWYEEGTPPAVSHVLRRGDPHNPAEEVVAGLPAILVDEPPPVPQPTARSSGRRLQLARWIASHDNPLTSRVIVNRIWQWHFGDGLVGSENDFGVMGQAPTHPELLDWLASEFATSGWQLKPLHRLIVLSSVYQQAALDQPEARLKDPEFDGLWSFPPRRLEAEAVRDCLLQVTGRLNPRRGGPSVYPEISAAVMDGQSTPGAGWGKSTPEEAARRSIYAFVKRTLLVPELEVLDLPSSEQCCEQRGVSTIAPQALTYFNGAFAQAQTAALAERLRREVGTDPSVQIERAFRLTLCRVPQPDEISACLKFLVAAQADAEHDALAALCLVLLNGNEFVYLN